MEKVLAAAYAKERSTLTVDGDGLASLHVCGFICCSLFVYFVVREDHSFIYPEGHLSATVAIINYLVDFFISMYILSRCDFIHLDGRDYVPGESINGNVVLYFRFIRVGRSVVL